MKRLLRSALVIARRDYTATVVSRAFLLFLLGPLFPIILGTIFSGIGARIAEDSERPVVAVLFDEADFIRLAEAREALERGFGSLTVTLMRVEPEGDLASQQRKLLASQSPPVVAVLSGSLERPRLVGSMRRDGTIVGQLRVMLDRARLTTAAAPPLHIVATGGPQPRSLSSARSLTARAGQGLLFLLTLLLAGMLLSQLIEEKSNKVIEILAAAVPIDAIFLGKLFAMLAVSLTGITVWGLTALAGIALFAAQGLASLPPPAVGWPALGMLVFVYFTMSYLLLGAMFLGIGAHASTVREVQTLSMPVTMSQVLIFGFASTAVGAHDSGSGVAATVFPLSSPYALLARAAELPDLWPHLLGIGWQMLWVAIIIHLAATHFRRSVLKSGPAGGFWRRRRTA